MNLIQSICCFFSSRCASGAADPKKADQDGYVETRDAGTAPPPPRPATPETEDSLRGRPWSKARVSPLRETTLPACDSSIWGFSHSLRCRLLFWY